jgi:hypothetical protein
MDVELELVLPGDVLIESDPPTVFEFREDCRLPVPRLLLIGEQDAGFVTKGVCGTGLASFAALARWRLPNRNPIYSRRSAISGSTFVARRAGM